MKHIIAPPHQKINKKWKHSTQPHPDNPRHRIITITEHNPDGTKTPRHTYTREYDTFFKTFHPFRHYNNEQWTEWALIAPQAHQIAVMNLTTGQIINQQPHTYTQEDLDKNEKLKEYYKVGDEQTPFYPTQFRVFNIREQFGKIDNQYINQQYNNKPLFSPQTFHNLSGQWAIYTGCVWGDDTTMKVRHIDLSNITEGKLTVSEKWGYVELQGTLKQVEYWSDSDKLWLPELKIVAGRE